MSKYHVAEAVGRFFVIMDTDDNKYANHVYFNGYDFMGSVNWENQFSFDFALETREEAEQIVKDLEAADEPDEPEEEQETDPVEQQMKSLQQSLDTCRSRRNDAWDLYDKFRTMENPNEGLINNAYLEYTREQAFYEGFMMAVFAAGYTITTAVGTDECTIVKEAR